MPLDPATYPLADQPWAYSTVDGTLRSWGYAAVGDHCPSSRLTLEGFLVWEKFDPKTQQIKVFTISTPRWRAHGFQEPVWPAAVITRALRAQEVYQRFGSDDLDVEDCEVIPLSKKPAKRGGTAS